MAPQTTGKNPPPADAPQTDPCQGVLTKLSPTRVVIDGDGLGTGIYDQIRHRGYGHGLHEFHGMGQPFDSAQYFNRRAECWHKIGEWLKSDAEIPDDPEMEVDLCGLQYGYSSKQQIQLEKKEDMKARGLASLDLGDCLAMTFSVTVQPRSVSRSTPRNSIFSDACAEAGAFGPDAIGAYSSAPSQIFREKPGSTSSH